jgi:NAD(P)-dependent dehydrogenase (short-subunit alcohol dehydrogenase family)
MPSLQVSSLLFIIVLKWERVIRILINFLLGVTDTPLVRGGISNDKADIAKVEQLAAPLASRIPLGRMAYPTGIADILLFLLPDASSFVTGQVIPVNGGSD